MCLSCGCMRPAWSHDDSRTITYRNFTNGNLTPDDYQEAADYNKGSVSQARKNVKDTMRAIKTGKVSESLGAPAKRK